MSHSGGVGTDWKMTHKKYRTSGLAGVLSGHGLCAGQALGPTLIPHGTGGWGVVLGSERGHGPEKISPGKDLEPQWVILLWF